MDPLAAAELKRVERPLQVLEKAGLLQVEYGRIHILDLEGLRDFQG